MKKIRYLIITFRNLKRYILVINWFIIQILKPRKSIDIFKLKVPSLKVFQINLQFGKKNITRSKTWSTLEMIFAEIWFSSFIPLLRCIVYDRDRGQICTTWGLEKFKDRTSAFYLHVRTLHHGSLMKEKNQDVFNSIQSVLVDITSRDTSECVT